MNTPIADDLRRQRDNGVKTISIDTVISTVDMLERDVFMERVRIDRYARVIEFVRSMEPI